MQVFKNMEIIAEVVRLDRLNQVQKWGEQNHESLFWLGICTEELGEVAKEMITTPVDKSKLYAELVQLAASASAAAQAIKFGTA
jgi:hypothetical protein